MSTLDEERFEDTEWSDEEVESKSEKEKEDDSSCNRGFLSLNISKSERIRLLNLFMNERENTRPKKVLIKFESIEKQMKEIKVLLGQLFHHFMNEPIRESILESDINFMCKTLARSFELKRIMRQPISRLMNRCSILEKKKEFSKINITILLNIMTEVLINAKLCSVPVQIIRGFATVYKDFRQVAMDYGMILKETELLDDFEVYLNKIVE